MNLSTQQYTNVLALLVLYFRGAQRGERKNKKGRGGSNPRAPRGRRGPASHAIRKLEAVVQSGPMCFRAWDAACGAPNRRRRTHHARQTLPRQAVG